MSSNSNRGGARPGAGRPRKPETREIPVKPGFKWFSLGLPDQLWQEFKEAASETIIPLGSEVQESDYMRVADLVMSHAIVQYVDSKKRADKKKGKQNEQ